MLQDQERTGKLYGISFWRLAIEPLQWDATDWFWARPVSAANSPAGHSTERGTKPLHDGADNRGCGQSHGTARRNALDHGAKRACHGCQKGRHDGLCVRRVLPPDKDRPGSDADTGRDAVSDLCAGRSEDTGCRKGRGGARDGAVSDGPGGSAATSGRTATPSPCWAKATTM